MNESVRKPVLKASEVAQFCYCSVAWHLQRQGYKPESPALEIGAERHKNLGEQIDTISKRRTHITRLQWIGVGFLVLAICFFYGGGLLVNWGGLMFYPLLIIAIIILSFSYSKYRYIKKVKGELGIPEGKIIYTDLDKPAKPLFSKSFWLTGKPDYIVKQSEGYIPVEVKVSVTDEPYRGHLMQLASYCLLIEEQYGKTILYGVISYGDGRQFKIPFTSNLRTEIIGILEKMRLQLRTNVVERNHTSTAKCEACSLKKHCTQAIE